MAEGHDLNAISYWKITDVGVGGAKSGALTYATAFGTLNVVTTDSAASNTYLFGSQR